MRTPIRHAVSCFSLALLAAGCALHEVNQTPAPALVSTDTFQNHPGDNNVSGSVPEWWRGFADPRLNHWIHEALNANFELKSFVARIERAEAVFRQAGGTLKPELSGGAQFTSSWPALDEDAGSRDDLLEAGVSLSWEIDLWGRLRSLRAARGAELEVAEFQYAGARLTLATAVAETYFQALETRLQLALLDDQIQVNETLLSLTRLRFGQGQSSIVDVLQQQEQLASTRALKPELETRLGALHHALDVLAGRPAGHEAVAAAGAIPRLPPLPDPGLPSELLENRPDLRAARQAIVAVDYTVAQAVAERLPRFVIGGSLTAVGDPSFQNLVADAFAALTGPIFDAGQRREEVAVRRAELKEAIAVYQQTYLRALGETETALLADRQQAERVDRLREQLDTARRLLTETRNRYSQGLTDYLPVLAALTTVQQLERDVLTNRREQLSRRVDLHRALGGGSLTPVPFPADPA